MAYDNTSINGDLAVGRNIIAGGDVNADGGGTVKGNLHVEGWLHARNIIGACKGLFKTLDDLTKAYPNPRSGLWAIVGDTVPGEVYRAEDGEWVATGKTCGNVVVDASNSNSMNLAVQQISVVTDKNEATLQLRTLAGKKVGDAATLPAATSEEAGVMSAAQAQQLDKATADIAQETSDRRKEDTWITDYVKDVAATVTTETTERKAADTTLQTNIDAETKERKAADTTLRTKISALKATATTSADGLMSAEDKTKLDGVAEGAQTPIDFTVFLSKLTSSDYGNAIRDTFGLENNNNFTNTTTRNNVKAIIESGQQFFALVRSTQSSGIHWMVKHKITPVVYPRLTSGEAYEPYFTFLDEYCDDYPDMDIKDGVITPTVRIIALMGDHNEIYSASRKDIKTLTANLSTETTERKAADTTLQENIDALKATATTSADGLMSAAQAQQLDKATADIAQETSDRRKEDTWITDYVKDVAATVTTETTERKAADTTLQENISNVQTFAETEESERIKGEAVLQGQIDTNKANIDALKATATTSADGLMSAEDKTKLDTLSSGGNTDYVSNIALTQSASHPDWARFTVQKGNSTQYAFDLANATSTVQGLMSATDKANLDTLSGGTDSHYLTALTVTQTRPYYVDITPSFGGEEGSKISIGVATESAAGVMSAGDKKKLNAYPDWETLNARIAALEAAAS